MCCSKTREEITKKEQDGKKDNLALQSAVLKQKDSNKR